MVDDRRRFLSIPVLLLVGWVLGWVLGCVGDPRPVPDGPNVVLISVDTLRADRMQLYGHERDTTPVLSRLADEAVVFEQAYHNGGGTLPSHMTMMTSLHPATHGVSPDSGETLPAERTTLAEALWQGGWDTAAFVDGGWMAGKFGFEQGFGLYRSVDGGGLAEILGGVERWLGRPRKRPVFLFVHTYDVHSKTDRLPYECPGNGQWHYGASPAAADGFDGCLDGRCASELLADLDAALAAGELAASEALSPAAVEWMLDLYDGCLRYSDGMLGELFGLLKASDLWRDTLLVVTTDHGEEFLDQGRLLHHQNGFDAIARVPLLIKWPGGEFGGRRVSHLAATADLMPTVLDIVGVPPPAPMQGTSLRPTVADDWPVREDVHVYSVLRRGRYKYFADGDRLFDLQADPGETAPVQAADAILLENLRQRVWHLVRQDRALREDLETGGAGGFDLSTEERQRLEALGYVLSDEAVAGDVDTGASGTDEDGGGGNGG